MTIHDYAGADEKVDALVAHVRVCLRAGAPLTTRELAMFIADAINSVEPTLPGAAAHVTTLAATAIQRLALADDHHPTGASGATPTGAPGTVPAREENPQ